MPVSDAVAVFVSAAVITPLTDVFIVSDERMPVSLLSYAMNSAAAAEVSVAVLSELFEIVSLPARRPIIKHKSHSPGQRRNEC